MLGSNKTQNVLVPKRMSVKNVFLELLTNLQEFIVHYTEYTWSDWQRSRARLMSPNTTLVFETDFSALGNLTPYTKVNSHVDGHYIVDVWMVYSNRRLHKFKRKDKDGNGVDDEVILCDTHVWFFVSDAKSKTRMNKLNNYNFHHLCLDYLLDYYKAANVPVDHAHVHTDGSGNQYRCCHCMAANADCSLRHDGVRVTHTFARKTRFKCSCDSNGGVYKRHCQDCERKLKKRLEEAFLIFEEGHTKLTVETVEKLVAWERSGGEKVLKNTTCTMNERKFRFITWDKAKYDECHPKYPDAVLDGSKLEKIVSKKLHTKSKINSRYEVRGFAKPTHPPSALSRAKWEVDMAVRACSCDPCLLDPRSSDCVYKKHRQVFTTAIERAASAAAVENEDGDEEDEAPACYGDVAEMDEMQWELDEGERDGLSDDEIASESDSFEE